MPYADLREYLEVLDGKNLIKRINHPVDKDWEIAAVARVAFQHIRSSERPALMFTTHRRITIDITGESCHRPERF